MENAEEKPAVAECLAKYLPSLNKGVFPSVYIQEMQLYENFISDYRD